MAPKVLLRPQVQADLDAIWDFIAADNMTAADRLLDRVGAAIEMLAHNPRAGRERPELAPSLRSFPIGNYVIFYLPLDKGVDVVRVLSGYLDIDATDFD
jgi:toxin ParE1/3/4